MSIRIARLKDELLRMSSEDAPGQEFCEAISEPSRNRSLCAVKRCFARGSLRTSCGDAISKILQPLWRVASAWARDAAGGLSRHARQRLTSLTRLQQASNGGSPPVWQEIQRALDGQQNDLLRTAFALEMLELIEPAVARATHLRECVVDTASSEEGRSLSR